MTNKEIAGILEEIAEFLELKGENPFKVRAFSNGARIVEGFAQEASELVKSGELRKVKGIGETLAEVIESLVKTGKSRYYEELRKGFPKGFLELLEIPGVGPKRATVLYDKLGIKSVAELEYACQENRLLSLDGFGEKSQAKILEAIKHHNKTKGYFLISDAQEAAERLVAYLKKSKAIIRIEIAGSLRRWKEIVHDIDVLVSTEKPAAIHAAFISYSEVDQVLAKGETKSSVILKSGIQADLRTVTDKEFPYALYYFTGSKEHNVQTRTIAKRMGLKISEYGIFRGSRLIPCKDEADIFKTLKLNYVPPELRENTGEIEAAACSGTGSGRAGVIPERFNRESRISRSPIKDFGDDIRTRTGTGLQLPQLIEQKDIRGTFHVHSTYSDGIHELEAMIRHAGELGYEYVGISDHSKSATYANGLSEERLKKQRDEIETLRKKYKSIRIFHGIESDILQDGSLDYSEKVLSDFDFVIGSIHSRFQMSEKEMTHRIVRAMSNPHMTFWGHPTGRLLLGRAGYPVHFDAIFEAAKKYRVVVEINANPNRLDLDWRLMRRAKEFGLRFGIHPDAHNTEGLSDMMYGVGIARKGWLEKSDVLNTLSASKIEKFLKGRKE